MFLSLSRGLGIVVGQSPADIVPGRLAVGAFLGLTGGTQNTVRQQRPHPQRWPTQRQVPLVINLGSLEARPTDFNLRVVKKACQPSTVKGALLGRWEERPRRRSHG
jgi:hypothetical protein